MVHMSRHCVMACCHTESALDGVLRYAGGSSGMVLRISYSDTAVSRSMPLFKNVTGSYDAIQTNCFTNNGLDIVFANVFDSISQPIAYMLRWVSPIRLL